MLLQDVLAIYYTDNQLTKFYQISYLTQISCCLSKGAFVYFFQFSKFPTEFFPNLFHVQKPLCCMTQRRTACIIVCHKSRTNTVFMIGENFNLSIFFLAMLTSFVENTSTSVLAIAECLCQFSWLLGSPWDISIDMKGFAVPNKSGGIIKLLSP